MDDRDDRGERDRRCRPVLDSARHSGGGRDIVDLRNVVLAAGRASGSEFLDETWHLRIRDEGRATYVFDRSHFARDGRFLALGYDPSGKGLSFRFAGSSDGSIWSAWLDSPRIDDTWRFVKVEVRLQSHGGVSPRLMTLGFAGAGAGSGEGMILIEASVPPLVGF